MVIELAGRMGGYRVVEMLMRVTAERGLPEMIRLDNGPEFTRWKSGDWTIMGSGPMEHWVI